MDATGVNSSSVNPSGNEIDKLTYLNKAVEQANRAESTNQLTKDEIAVSQSKDNAYIPTIDSPSHLKTPVIASQEQFDPSTSLVISQKLQSLVSDQVNMELKLLVVMGTVLLTSGMISEREGIQVAKAAYIAKRFIKPMSDLVKAEGLQTAAATKRQADMYLSQGITGIAGSLVEIGAGVGGMMNAASSTEEGAGPRTSQNVELREQEEGINTDEEEGMNMRNRTQSVASDDSAISNTSSQDDVGRSTESKQEEGIAKKRMKQILSGGKNVLKLFGANNMTLGMALSKMITSTDRFYAASAQTQIGDIQTKEATIRAESKKAQMLSELVQSNQNRVQSASKSLDDMRDSVGQSIKEFNQANNASARSVFG